MEGMSPMYRVPDDDDSPEQRERWLRSLRRAAQRVADEAKKFAATVDAASWDTDSLVWAEREVEEALSAYRRLAP